MTGEGFPGAGLWSTTGRGEPSSSTPVGFGVTDQPAAAGFVPAVSKPTTPAIIHVVPAKGRINQWSTGCPRCKCCGYLPCARCCCPCTCCRFFSWLCAILVVFVLAIGVVVLVFWKILHPKLPTYNVDNVQFKYSVTGAAATNANSVSGPSSYVLNAETTFQMELGNPNQKIGIYYDQIKLNVQIFGLLIGNQIVPAFYDGYGVTKSVSGDMKSGAVPLSAANQAALSAAQTAGKVPLNLKVDVKVRARVGLWVSPQLKVGLLCILTVDPNVSSGSQISGMTCKFKLF